MTDSKDDARELSDERQRKAAWMNDQLAERLAPVEQAGVGPAPDARPEDAFTTGTVKRARERAANAAGKARDNK